MFCDWEKIFMSSFFFKSIIFFVSEYEALNPGPSTHTALYVERPGPFAFSWDMGKNIEKYLL